jgi:peptide-methionine (S)-S-oxide reductase
MTAERAVLAGGCFWGMQDLIRRYDGVLSTRAGYTGGSLARATNGNHGSHAEAVEVIFAPGLWPGKVVTEVVPAGDFWEAEPEHQDYLQRNPGGYTCHFVRPNWKLPARTSPPCLQT